MPISPPNTPVAGPGALIGAALDLGHVQLRRGRMESRNRYRIDRRDPAVTRVLINIDLTPSEYAGALETIAGHLADIATERRRGGLAVVPELEGDAADEVETVVARPTLRLVAGGER